MHSGASCDACHGHVGTQNYLTCSVSRHEKQIGRADRILSWEEVVQGVVIQSGTVKDRNRNVVTVALPTSVASACSSV